MPEPFQSRFHAIRPEMVSDILANNSLAYQKGFLDPLVETIISEFTGQEVIFSYNDFRSPEREELSYVSVL